MLRILDKPAGLTTHTSLSKDERRKLEQDPVDSFLGHLCERSGVQLWPVHRLDVGTTGVLLAAESAEEAAELSHLFEARTVEKIYYFLTDREPSVASESPLRVESYINRENGGRGTNFFSREGSNEHPVNAKTEFEHINSLGQFSLWRAKPETGRPHQIRLHAETLGISILGDGEHGGARFPTLCLHSASIRFSLNGEIIEATSPSPRWFTDLGLLSNATDLRIVGWIAAVERRERLSRSLQRLGVKESETIRLIHTEGLELRADRLGAVVQFHWYTDEFDIIDRKAVENLASLMGWRDWYIQTRKNRGKNPNDTEVVLSHPEIPTRWSAKEDDLAFSFRRDTGLSAGLFLDQRANRRWTFENAKDARVLNLFSYTSGFSVAAAKAGAQQVVSVDLSRNFLLWSKDNFLINGLNPDDEKFEFRAMEARDFLKWAKKKALKFDLIICDPPSFARSDSGVFRIEKDLEAILQSCVDVTAAGGIVLFSTNYELLNEEDFYTRLRDFADTSATSLRLSRTPSPDFDFEFPREPRLMKSVFIEVLSR